MMGLYGLFDKDPVNTGRQKALNADPDAEPKEVLKNVRNAIDRFVGDAPQFDDITMLSLKYNGGKKS